MKRIATVMTVLAASLVLAAPATVSSASSDGSSVIAKGRWGCC